MIACIYQVHCLDNDNVFCRHQQPPEISSSLVQAFIRHVIPTCLPRAVLSKGIQHPDALVHYTTLCTLHKVLQILRATFQVLQAALHTLSESESQSVITETTQRLRAQDSGFQAQALSIPRSDPDAHTQHSDSAATFASAQLSSDIALTTNILDSVADSAFASLCHQQQQEDPCLADAQHGQEQGLLLQWANFMLQLRQACRARLPDPQSLLALSATLHKGSTQPAVLSKEADTAPELAADSRQADASDTSQVQSESGPPSQMHEDNSAVNQGSGNDVEDQSSMTAQELTSTMLVMVLNAYQSCLPEAMSDSRIDVVSLMPQVQLCTL